MANNCSFEIHIKGERSSCEYWVELMRGTAIANNFCRIFHVDVIDVSGDDDDCTMILCGDCAWSLETCCRESGYAGEDLFALHTSELCLIMEAYSEEPGVGFMEHYIYNNGECFTDECVDYMEWFWDRDCYTTYDDFMEALGYERKNGEFQNVPKEEDFDADGFYRVGGLEWNFSI